MLASNQQSRDPIAPSEFKILSRNGHRATEIHYIAVARGAWLIGREEHRATEIHYIAVARGT
jgi:hypothetical protein